MKIQRLNINYSKLLTPYIVLQPIIDILIFYFLTVLENPLTPGLIIRNLALVGVVLYVLFVEKKHAPYLIVVGVFYAIHFAINYYYKSPFNMFEEISYFSKYVFFLAGLITVIHMVKKERERNPRFGQSIVKAMWIAMAITSLVIIIGAITNTGIQSYSSDKIGQTGWFFSGNKIGSAMVILFPVSLLYTIQNEKSNLLHWALIVCNIIAMFMTGTKTTYAGILLGLLAAVFILGVRIFAFKERRYKKSLLITVILLVAVIAYTPISPVYTNISIQDDWTVDGKETDLLFNGREIKVADIQQSTEESNIARILFGVGYGGDYKDPTHISPIERDFHEVYFYYGIVGFFLLLVYPFMIILKLVIDFFRNIREISIEGTLLLTSVGCALGCAYIAGHVLFAPSVTIYLMSVIAVLTTVDPDWNR